MTYAGHLVTDRDRTIALYRVNTFSYPLLTDAAKAELLTAWSRWAHKLEADFTVYRVTRYVNADDYARTAKTLADPRGDRTAYRALVDRHVDVIDALQAWTVETYVAVNLSAQQQVASGIDTAKTVRKAIVGLRGRKIDGAIEREAVVRDLIRPLAGRPVTGAELQWLFRRAATRGRREPATDPHFIAVRDRSVAKMRRRWLDAPVAEEPRAVVVGDADDHSYQSILTVGARPEVLEFPGCEFMFNPPESLPFPIDLALHVRWVSNADAMLWAGQKVKDADGAWSEATGAHADPPTWKIGEDKRLTRDLVRYLGHPSHPPLLWATLSAVVAAPTRSELEKRRRAVANAFGAIRVDAPRYVQGPLWWDHVPGTTGRHDDRFEEPMTTDEFGALMPNGTHEAGDRRGVYIAHTEGEVKRPVLIDLPSAPLGSGLPGWLITGVYGSGKTLFGELLLIQAVLRGSVGVTIDPKADHYAAEYLASRGVTTQIIEPTGTPDDQGLLDPLVVAPPAMREDRAVSYYLDLIGDKDGYETQIIRAVRAVLDTPEPCGMAVIDALRSSDHERGCAAGEDLAVRAESGIGRLGFASRSSDVARHAQMTTIRPRGLDLPRAGLARENWSRDQRLGVATMKLLVALGLRLLGEDRSVHKVFGPFDELHVFRDNDGQQLIEQAAHYGRSYNASALFLAQLDTMVTDELARLVGYRAEMKHKGEGVLRDHTGRAARIRVDFADPEMLAVLNTAPDAARNRRPSPEEVPV